ncbi:helix-turn-helix transcriptional regulator [Chelatococcus asaccharovorans]|uniref:helix-turn-helix transcriptional regulator n=1 Tax=Chelatococcus asaccharovorans TaxID=28210 RepID=UPI00224C7B42|nr:LuxR C-terminal-related transcriptional regulator [Chelatococcus asaccharovorans]CAH1655168.1 Regulatory LuxR family protein [Chelatococcus asaccharovorans]CAH1685511.1 Regulatory LuxR family protein [Chelatococcus asaccharovorans]
MALDMTPLSPDPDAALAESDVRAIVALLGEVITSRRDFSGVKRLLVEGICRLVEADAWTWSLGCAAQPGEQPIYLGLAHGGFDKERYARLLLAAGHADMTWTSEKLLGELRQKASHLTRVRQQIVDEASFAASGVNAYLCDADIGPFIFSLRPIDNAAVSTISIYRRRDARAFSEREARIAHILLSELPWLHEQGWPADRGATVPRLSPRLRLVLNLLLDGRTRKEMAVSLALSEYTVAQYQKAVYSHFGVNSHTALLRRFQMGDGGHR